MYHLGLIHRITLAALCFSPALLVSCEPYKQCDESLKVGDKLTFKLTEGLSLEEQIEQCGGELPFGVDSVFDLTVDKFGGGDDCDSASGPVEMEDIELEWLSPAAGNGSPRFRGNYNLAEEACNFELNLSFYDNRLYFRVYNSDYKICSGFCDGNFKGVWIE